MHVSPDTVAIAIDYLAGHAAIVALDAAVSSQLPGDLPDASITVQTTGTGGYRDRTAWVDETTLDVSCWAATEIEASQLARTARAALMGIVGYRHREGIVVDVDDLGGPGWLPDTSETPPRPRFVFSLAMSAHP